MPMKPRRCFSPWQEEEKEECRPHRRRTVFRGERWSRRRGFFLAPLRWSMLAAAAAIAPPVRLVSRRLFFSINGRCRWCSIRTRIIVLWTPTIPANTAGSLPTIVNRAGIGKRSLTRYTVVVHRVPGFITSMRILGAVRLAVLIVVCVSQCTIRDIIIVFGTQIIPANTAGSMPVRLRPGIGWGRVVMALMVVVSSVLLPKEK